MRVTTSLVYALGLDALNRQNEKLLKLQQQIAADRRILTPSDDPIGAAQAVTVTQAKARTTQYTANIGAAGDAIAHGESIVGQVADVLQAARAHAVSAGSPALSDADRRAIATDLRAQLKHLVGLANAKDGDGGYLFAGFSTDTQPFADSGTGVAYHGDGGKRMMAVGPGRDIAISESGDRVFMRVPAGNGTFVASAGVVNTGSGVLTPGSVVDANAVTGNTYRIEFNVAGGVTTYDVIDVTTSTTVSSGNAYTSGSSITVAGMQVRLDGAPENGDTFTLAPSAPQSVFQTIENLIATLEASAGNTTERTRLTNGINRGLADIDQALEHLLTVRAEMGAGLRELDSLASGNESQQLLHDTTLSRLQDLDYNAALSDFARQQLALEAAQKSFIQVTRLSLFNYL